MSPREEREHQRQGEEQPQQREAQMQQRGEGGATTQGGVQAAEGEAAGAAGAAEGEADAAAGGEETGSRDEPLQAGAEASEAPGGVLGRAKRTVTLTTRGISVSLNLQDEQGGWRQSGSGKGGRGSYLNGPGHNRHITGSIMWAQAAFAQGFAVESIPKGGRGGA